MNAVGGTCGIFSYSRGDLSFTKGYSQKTVGKKT